MSAKPIIEWFLRRTVQRQTFATNRCGLIDKLVISELFLGLYNELRGNHL
jgi:hypothetical protein